jgi:hypothetical protein
MEIFGNKNSQKLAKKYECKICDYVCCRKNDYTKHLSTRKHKMEINGNENSQKLAKTRKNNIVNCCDDTYSDNSIIDTHFDNEKSLNNHKCLCGKHFKSNSGIWKHKKNCKVLIEKETELDSTLVWNLVKQNQDFKEMMLEQQKYMTELAKNSNVTINHINGNNTNNTQNNQFNLQFFLNETCKDAMNINQFIDSIQIKLEDLEYTGKNGYVQGVSNVIVRELKSLDQKDRPLHCSDEKREVIYIKTNDVWEKDINHAGVTRFTKHITHKKLLKVNEWIAKYPTCLSHDDKRNDEYLNILGQIVSGLNQLNETEKPESLKKIIRTVAKQVSIQKSNALAL